MARHASRGFSLHSGLVPLMALALVTSLAGCQMSLPRDDASRAGSGLDLFAAGERRAVERDVEAPSVFNLEEPGLWDGRPSLGGVWVAHPGVRDPERVVIRNPATGAEVIGALFRRERENPGPQFQISSEAANALGILPGAPTRIRVTALRLERIEIEPPASQARPQPEPQTEQQALAAAPAQPAETTPAAPTAVASAPAPVDAGTVAIAPVEPAEAPRRGLFARRAPRGDVALEEGTIVQTALDTGAQAPAPLFTDPEIAAPAGATTESAAPRERGGLFGLFRRQPTTPEEPALIPLPEDAVQTASLAPTAPAAAPAAGQTLDRPFVQIGIFSIESNATNARAQMQAAGLDAQIRRGRANDREFWRVVVGPATDAGMRRQMLERVRGLGFADAYAVVR